jgi:hypothetical protein
VCRDTPFERDTGTDMSRQYTVSRQDRIVLRGPELLSFRTERERLHTHAGPLAERAGGRKGGWRGLLCTKSNRELVETGRPSR